MTLPKDELAKRLAATMTTKELLDQLKLKKSESKNGKVAKSKELSKKPPDSDGGDASCSEA